MTQSYVRFGSSVALIASLIFVCTLNNTFSFSIHSGQPCNVSFNGRQDHKSSIFALCHSRIEVWFASNDYSQRRRSNARLRGGHAPTVSLKDGRDMITNSAFGAQTFNFFWDARGSDTWLEDSGSTYDNQNTKLTSTEADWFVATHCDAHDTFTQLLDEQVNTGYADDENCVGRAEYVTIVGLNPILLAIVTVPRQGVCLVRPTTVHLADRIVKASFNFNDTTLEILIQHLVHPAEPERQSYLGGAETLGVCRNPNFGRYFF